MKTVPHSHAFSYVRKLPPSTTTEAVIILQRYIHEIHVHKSIEVFKPLTRDANDKRQLLVISSAFYFVPGAQLDIILK